MNMSGILITFFPMKCEWNMNGILSTIVPWNMHGIFREHEMEYSGNTNGTLITVFSWDMHAMFMNINGIFMNKNGIMNQLFFPDIPSLLWITKTQSSAWGWRNVPNREKWSDGCGYHLPNSFSHPSSPKKMKKCKVRKYCLVLFSQFSWVYLVVDPRNPKLLSSQFSGPIMAPPELASFMSSSFSFSFVSSVSVSFCSVGSSTWLMPWLADWHCINSWWFSFWPPDILYEHPTWGPYFTSTSGSETILNPIKVVNPTAVSC